MISNKQFSDLEKNILNIMIPHSFKYSKILYDQLNNCDVTREKTKYYSLTFLNVKENENKFYANGKSGIILEMLIYNNSEIPTDVLLHCRDGYLTELEIYNVDSSEIDYNMVFNNYKIICNIN